MSSPRDGSEREEMRILETKVVLLGNTDVGKTSMVNRYIRGQFNPATTATIGAAFMKKDVVLGNFKVVLQIWDTAGQERFRSMAPMYYRNAHAAILVFDATSPESLAKIDGWVEELRNHSHNNIILALACNKSDLRVPNSPNCVSPEQAQAYSSKINASLFETSAKTGQGIEQLFVHVARKMLEADIVRQRDQMRRQQAALTAAPGGPPGGAPTVVLDEAEERAARKKSKGCC